MQGIQIYHVQTIEQTIIRRPRNADTEIVSGRHLAHLIILYIRIATIQEALGSSASLQSSPVI